jgi:hypothetical protein
VGAETKEAALAASGGPGDEEVRHLLGRPRGVAATRPGANDDVVDGGDRWGAVLVLVRTRFDAPNERTRLDALGDRLQAEGSDNCPGLARMLAPVDREGTEAPPELGDEGGPTLRKLIAAGRPGHAEGVPRALDVAELRAADGLLVLPAVPREGRAGLGPAAAHAAGGQPLAGGDCPRPKLLLEPSE